VFFWFEGRRLSGIEGDSIAKALFRNGIRTLSRSVKYDRPRGIHCARGRCIMCHVEVDGVTGVKSCITRLAEGMRVNRQSYRPFYGSVFTTFLSRIRFPAGFYYRMFTRPRIVRAAFVATVRRLAGVGKIDTRKQPPRRLAPPPTELTALRDRYGVVVVGAGVSGMSAALAAADAGADVLLADEYAAPGGHALGRLAEDGLTGARDELIRRLADVTRLTVVHGATAQGYYDPGRLMVGREGKGNTGGVLKVISADAFVFATGAQDLIPLFENNDIPGVMGARAVRLFLERDGLVPGRNAAVYGTGPDLAATVALLRAWGVGIEVVAETSDDAPAGMPEGIRVVTGAKLAGAEGRGWIERAVFETGSARVTFPCDLLCVAVPGQPSFELAQQAGFDFQLKGNGGRADPKVMVPTADALDDGAGPPRFLVGEASGRSDWNDKIGHAALAGAAAAQINAEGQTSRS
jgi:sarcosine oxidase subunit alpha